MAIIHPAHAKPLSKNVKRLLKASRASPDNPHVVKAGRDMALKDLAFCDLQGNIFMAAVDRGIPMEKFAPMFMLSKLSAVIDFSFFHPGDTDMTSLPAYLQVPMLLKSPDVIVDTLLWIENIIQNSALAETPRSAIIREVCKEAHVGEGSANVTETVDGRRNGGAEETPDVGLNDSAVNDASAVNDTDSEIMVFDYIDENDIMKGEAHFQAGTTETSSPDGLDDLVGKYAYAYWLGYIYRYESLLHEEASRMVYAVLDESIMRETYNQLDLDDSDISDCAGEICRRLDLMIINKL